MEMIPFTFTVGGRLVGGARRPYDRRGRARLESLAFFCPQCGEIWARIEAADKSLPWYAAHQPCPRHGTGSLWHSYDIGRYPILPRTLLERELELALLLRENYGGIEQ